MRIPLSLLLFVINAFSYFQTNECSEFSTQSTISGNTTAAPYNAVTGVASGNVPAFSNGNDSYISEEYNFLHGVYMGIKWQCVEYSRRWLFIRKGCVFDSVDAAADMWNQLKYVQRVVDKKCFTFTRYANGSRSRPKMGSLLIYKRYGTDMPYGHVSVIVDVSPNFIRVAEENYYPYYWSGNYARQIPYKKIGERFYIYDDYPIYGWMKVNDQGENKPLNRRIINQILRLNQTSPDFICDN